jgi:flagellar motility protein MotE (MotC chaperone)
MCTRGPFGREGSNPAPSPEDRARAEIANLRQQALDRANLVAKGNDQLAQMIWSTGFHSKFLEESVAITAKYGVIGQRIQVLQNEIEKKGKEIAERWEEIRALRKLCQHQFKAPNDICTVCGLSGEGLDRLYRT